MTGRANRKRVWGMIFQVTGPRHSMYCIFTVLTFRCFFSLMEHVGKYTIHRVFGNVFVVFFSDSFVHG